MGCSQCTQVASVPASQAVAQVGHTPAPPPHPTTGAQPVVRPPSGQHPSMLTPPGKDVVRMRRRSTSQAGVARRTPASPTSRVVRGNRPGSPGEGSPTRRSRITRADERPLPPGGMGMPMARRAGDDRPAQDPTMVYMVVGAVLLLFGIFLVGYALFTKGDTPAPKQKQENQSPSRDEPTPRTQIEAPKSQQAPTRVQPAQPRHEPARKTEPASKTIPMPPIKVTIGEEPRTALSDLPADVPKILVMKPGAAPSVDGKLDDGCWARVEPQDLVFIDGRAERPTARCWFKLVATDKALYVAAYLSEPEMNRIVMPNRARDEAVWQDDCLELFMLPGLDPGKTKYQWVVNVAGNVWDGSGVGKTSAPETWNSDLRFKVDASAPDAWTVECMVPFSEVPEASRHGAWRFNLTRNRPKREGVERGDEYTSWSVLKSQSTHVPERFGVIALEALGGRLP
ncbi:MAG: hypothetical protein M5U26_20870 [Planctomycetota bacterium]|nr:hypothetical protein [Planctomycetota bacterium]